MTGWAGPGTNLPLSVVTVASLADLGYSVNYAAADPFTPTASLVAASRAALRTTSAAVYAFGNSSATASTTDVGSFHAGPSSNFGNAVASIPWSHPVAASRLDASLVDLAMAAHSTGDEPVRDAQPSSLDRSDVPDVFGFVWDQFARGLAFRPVVAIPMGTLA